jgi:DNA-binding response OmpR family regulator
MSSNSILTITCDDELLELLSTQLPASDLGERHLILARTIGEAGSLLAVVRPRLIVLHWSRHRHRYEDLNNLLWARTVLAHRVPIIVITDRYRLDEATKLYRMGVTEYISRTHHQNRFVPILQAHLRPVRASRLWATGPDDQRLVERPSSRGRTSGTFRRKPQPALISRRASTSA